jgi:hypothetical protein
VYDDLISQVAAGTANTSAEHIYVGSACPGPVATAPHQHVVQHPTSVHKDVSGCRTTPQTPSCTHLASHGSVQALDDHSLPWAAFPACAWIAAGGGAMSQGGYDTAASI